MVGWWGRGWWVLSKPLPNPPVLPYPHPTHPPSTAWTTLFPPFLPSLSPTVTTSKTTTRWKRKSFVTAGKTWLVVLGRVVGEWEMMGKGIMLSSSPSHSPPYHSYSNFSFGKHIKAIIQEKLIQFWTGRWPGIRDEREGWPCTRESKSLVNRGYTFQHSLCLVSSVGM